MLPSLERDRDSLSKGSLGNNNNVKEASVFVIGSDNSDVSSLKLEKASQEGEGNVDPAAAEEEECVDPDPDPKNIELKRTCQQRFLGMALMMAASACLSMAVTIAKMLSTYDVFSIGAWVACCGCSLPSALILLYYQFGAKSKPFQPIHPLCQLDKFKTFCLVMVRAVTGTGSTMFQLYALQYISVSDTTVIAFSCPVFVTFLARVLLGESFGVMNVVAALLTLIGVGIITRPSFLTGVEMDSNTMVGVGIALSAMVCGIFGFLSLRMISAVHFAVSNLFYGLVGTTLCCIMSVSWGTFELPHSAWDWFLATAFCTLGFGGLVFQTVAFRYEDAGPLSLCRSFDVIFSFLWQGIFLSIMPDTYSVIGSVVVLSGVLLVGLRKHLASLPEEHPCRKTCCCILK